MYINSNSTLSDSYALKSVSGVTYVGGAVGYSRQNVDLTEVYSHGQVTGSGDYVGGIDGGSDQSGRDYTRVYSTGAVSGGQFVGGISGRLQGNLSESFSTGDVTGTNIRVGGAVGYHGSGSIYDTFANGTIKGPERVGGIVGDAQGGVASIYDNYFTGVVIKASGGTASHRFGPIAGERNNNNRIATASCYYRTDGGPVVIDEDTGLALAAANTLGTPLTSTEMGSSANFAELDFAGSIWKMPASGYRLPEGVTSYGFPILGWMN